MAASGDEQADYPVAGPECGYIVGDGGDGGGDFVAQSYAGGDAAAQNAAHHQQVVMAETAGVHPQQGRAGAGRGNGAFYHRQGGRAAGFDEGQGGHSFGNRRKRHGHSGYGNGRILRYWGPLAGRGNQRGMGSYDSGRILRYWGQDTVSGLARKIK